jgi:hypothetical protein
MVSYALPSAVSRREVATPMPKTFTLEEARALLPQLRSLVSEMRDVKAKIDAMQGDVAKARDVASGNGNVRDRSKIGEAEKLTARLTDLMEQVNELGCEIKGIDEGLIDFPAEREGRPVYLCWRLGEDEISYWHDLDTGFGGRQPL